MIVEPITPKDETIRDFVYPPDDEAAERNAGFARMIAMALESKRPNMAREIAAAFERTESTVERWAHGFAVPSTHIQERVLKWLAAPERRK